MCNFSKHAIERLDGRMHGLVSERDILKAVAKAGPMGLGETAIFLKRLARPLTIKAADGSVSMGDVVVAVFRRNDRWDDGCITTVELRSSKQPRAARWSAVIDLTN